jgi:hypothetical protein
MLDLIGLPYELGADPSSGKTDCIRLVYEVRNRLGLSSPPLDLAWYSGSKISVLRALLTWGTEVQSPLYDGDVALASQNDWAFGVAWQSGILRISELSKAVAWFPIASLQGHCRYFRGKSS